MINEIKKIIKKNILNSLGWSSKNKIVVIESDDWGSIRIPSKNSLTRLSEFGVKVTNCHYVQNDALASEEDLEKLFSVLKKYRGLSDRHPVITANAIMGNPDFDKIRASEFTEYHYEQFTESLKNYPFHGNSFELWKYGINEHIFFPQYHGREHLNVSRWMEGLKDSGSVTRKAFDLGIFGLSTSVTPEHRKSYMAAYDWENRESREFVLKSIDEGIEIFQTVFDYPPLSAIAPNYVWHEDVETMYHQHNIKYIQGGHVQKSPNTLSAGYTLIRHYNSEKNDLGQRYLVRNCTFEPSSNKKRDWVKSCLSDISNAFFWNQPAIIESHRVNYIGYVNSDNRDHNLKLLDQLLHEILNRWPDVEFLTSAELGSKMDEQK